MSWGRILAGGSVVLDSLDKSRAASPGNDDGHLLAKVAVGMCVRTSRVREVQR